MHYRLFGGLQVQHDDRPLELGPPKQRAVLAVLLVEAGRVVAADRMVELLWGDDATKARSSLQAYISHLRRILGSEVLLTQSPGYRLAVERADIDVYRFLDLVANGRAELRDGDAAAARVVLDEALTLWDSPLPEFAAEPFAVELNERLRAARLSAIEGAAEADLALGDHASAIARLEPEAADQSLQERLHWLLALALYRAGRQADALRAIDRVRRALADTAGLELGPELRQLEADVLAHAKGLSWEPPPDRPAPTRPPTPMLVGRDSERRELLDALDRAGAGHGGTAVLIGEPGIGKTRLLEDLRDAAAARGFSTAWARCAESGAAPPFWPITQISEQLRDAGVLGREMVAPDDRDSDETAAARVRFEIYRAVAARLATLDRPLLAVIDDIQWADPDSLRLLEHLAAELAPTRVLIAVSTRPLDDTAPDALVDCLAEVARSPNAVQLRLGGLDVGAVSMWLSSVATSTEDVAVVIHERSGGNALFVKELVDLLAAEGRLDDPEAVRSARGIPPGVQFVVRRRVARLPAVSQQLLSIAAVIGHSFEPEVLAAAAECETVEALDALSPAFDAGLLVDAGTTYRFSHALVADALADEVNASRRARIHAAAARALADAAGPSLGPDVAVIAHHAHAGIAAGTGALAIDASIRAAELAVARSADLDAANHWSGAAVALARHRPADVAARVGARIEEANALLRADHTAHAKAAVLTAIDDADAGDLVDEMVRAAMLLNHAHVWTNEAYAVVDDRAIAALERTLARMDHDDLVRRAEVLAALASELVFSDARRHRTVCDEAEEVARAAGDPRTLARVLVAVQLPNRPGDLDVRARRAHQIVDLVELNALSEDLAFAGHHHLAQVAFEMADIDRSAAHLADARAAIANLPGTKFRSQLYWFESAIHFLQGRYETGQALSAEAHQIHRRARGVDADILWLAGVLIEAVDLGGLEPFIDTMPDQARRTAYRRNAQEQVAFGLLEAGRPDLAGGLIAEFGDEASFPDDWTTLTGATAALHVRAELELVDATAAVHAFLEPYAGRWACSGSSPAGAGPVDLALARADALLGDTDRARVRFASAVQTCDRNRTLAWLTRSLVHQGRFLTASGEVAAGQAALARAGELADRHGFVYLRRRLHTPKPRRAKPAPTGRQARSRTLGP